MKRFVAIARDLDVGDALAEALSPETFWMEGADGCSIVSMMAPRGPRTLEAPLAACWALVDAVRVIAARDFGDTGRLDYVRLGKMYPGARILPHADGYDGMTKRRYQIILQSGLDAVMAFEDDSRAMAAGEAWQVGVRDIHWVDNPGPVERINLVFDSFA